MSFCCCFFVKQESKKKCWENNDNRYNYIGVCYETRTESAPPQKKCETQNNKHYQFRINKTKQKISYQVKKTFILHVKWWRRRRRKNIEKFICSKVDLVYFFSCCFFSNNQIKLLSKPNQKKKIFWLRSRYIHFIID